MTRAPTPTSRALPSPLDKRSDAEEKPQSTLPYLKPSPPRAPSVDAAMLSVFKSDCVLLQSKMVGGERDERAPATIEAEFKLVLQQATDLGGLLAREKYATVEEALRVSALKLGLRDLLDRKMQALEKQVLQQTQLGPTSEMPASLSRLPSFLALVDRTLHLHRSSASSTKGARLFAPECKSAPADNQRPADAAKVEADIQALTRQIDTLQSQKQAAQSNYARQEAAWRHERGLLELRCQQQKDMLVQLTEAVDLHSNQSNLLRRECQSRAETLDELSRQVADRDSAIQALRDDAEQLQAQHSTAMNAAKTETNRVRADVQRLQRTVEELQTTNFDYKKFVQTITEEDDAIRDQLEAMLATGLGVLRYSNVGVACLKLGVTLERVVYALHEKVAPRSCTLADDDRANVLAIEVRMREVQLDALRNEVDELHIGFRTMEKLAADRLDALEQLRSELDQANAQAAARSDAQRQIMSSLQQEIACHIESIAQLQAEKRSALTTSATEIESYEDVLKEEFAVMRKAYELKAKQAQEQLEVQEKNHFKQLHELLRNHKEDRVLGEIRAKKIQHELQILKEKYAVSGTGSVISITDPLGGANSNVAT